MDYREYTVPSSLGRHVQCLWRLRDPAPPDTPQTVYPDGRCELIVHLAQPMHIQTPDGNWQLQSRCLFAAQARGAIRLRAAGALDCVGVRLRPAASAALFTPSARDAPPLAARVDQVIDLAMLDPVLAHELERTLRGQADILAPAFLELLAARLLPQPIDARVEAAAAAIDEACGNRPTRTLAKVVGMSLRSLQTRFRAAVGLTVKEYALVQRLHATIKHLDAGASALAQTALDAGFADQAHATRAVRAFAGLTPAKLRNALLAERDGDRTLALAAAFVRGESTAR